MSELKIMTLNVKNASITSSFAKRAISIQELVRWHDPDIIGTQELIDPMIDYLPELTETYTFYGKARGSAGNTNERTCLLFKKDRFELLRGDTFWLSSTPDVRGSRFLESLFPRISTFALLKDKLTEQTFTFANTHLDHLLPATRAKQAAVLRDKLIEVKDGDFLVLTGDFNSSYLSLAVHTLVSSPELDLKDTVPTDGVSTIRSFIQAGTSHFRPIDHILVSENLEVLKSEIITGMYMGRYPSDHCPVLTVIKLPEAE